MSIAGTGTAGFFDRARLDMAGLRARAEGYQQQISTGERLSRSSDDPVAASRLRTLSRAEGLSAAQRAGAQRAEADLALADNALSAITDALSRARDLAVQAASETLNDSQRAAIGTELEQIHAALFALANTRDSSGHALFGGQASGPAYTLDGAGNAVYAGTAAAGALDLGENQTVTRGLTGPEIFDIDTGGGPEGIMTVIAALAGALGGAVADPADAARSALGQLSAGIEATTTAQTAVGTRLAFIELATQRHAERSESRAGEQARTGGTDIAETITRLQETMLILEASQASFARLSGLSLIDQLR